MLDAMYLRGPGYGVTGSGAAGGARTRGLLFPKQARFQLRYSSKKAPDPSWGPALQPGRCRGTYPPPAAGCSLACMAAKEKAAGRDCLPRLRLSQVHYTMPGM